MDFWFLIFDLMINKTKLSYHVVLGGFKKAAAWADKLALFVNQQTQNMAMDHSYLANNCANFLCYIKKRNIHSLCSAPWNSINISIAIGKLWMIWSHIAFIDLQIVPICLFILYLFFQSHLEPHAGIGLCYLSLNSKLCYNKSCISFSSYNFRGL